MSSLGQSCRICGQDSSSEKLCSPCRCNGSIRWVHQSCLDRWVRQSPNLRRQRCELCSHEFSYRPVYAEGTPDRLGFREFAEGVRDHFLVDAQNNVMRLVVVWLSWAAFLPFVSVSLTRLAVLGWRSLLHDSMGLRMSWVLGMVMAALGWIASMVVGTVWTMILPICRAVLRRRVARGRLLRQQETLEAMQKALTEQKAKEKAGKESPKEESEQTNEILGAECKGRTENGKDNKENDEEGKQNDKDGKQNDKNNKETDKDSKKNDKDNKQKENTVSETTRVEPKSKAEADFLALCDEFFTEANLKRIEEALNVSYPNRVEPTERSVNRPALPTSNGSCQILIASDGSCKILHDADGGQSLPMKKEKANTESPKTESPKEEAEQASEHIGAECKDDNRANDNDNKKIDSDNRENDRDNKENENIVSEAIRVEPKSLMGDSDAEADFLALCDELFTQDNLKRIEQALNGSYPNHVEDTERSVNGQSASNGSCKILDASDGTCKIPDASDGSRPIPEAKEREEKQVDERSELPESSPATHQNRFDVMRDLFRTAKTAHEMFFIMEKTLANLDPATLPSDELEAYRELMETLKEAFKEAALMVAHPLCGHEILDCHCHKKRTLDCSDDGHETDSDGDDDDGDVECCCCDHNCGGDTDSDLNGEDGKSQSAADGVSLARKSSGDCHRSLRAVLSGDKIHRLVDEHGSDSSGSDAEHAQKVKSEDGENEEDESNDESSDEDFSGAVELLNLGQKHVIRISPGRGHACKDDKRRFSESSDDDALGRDVLSMAQRLVELHASHHHVFSDGGRKALDPSEDETKDTTNLGYYGKFKMHVKAVYTYLRLLVKKAARNFIRTILFKGKQLNDRSTQTDRPDLGTSSDILDRLMRPEVIAIVSPGSAAEHLLMHLQEPPETSVAVTFAISGENGGIRKERRVVMMADQNSAASLDEFMAASLRNTQRRAICSSYGSSFTGYIRGPRSVQRTAGVIKSLIKENAICLLLIWFATFLFAFICIYMPMKIGENWIQENIPARIQAITMSSGSPAFANLLEARELLRSEPEFNAWLVPPISNSSFWRNSVESSKKLFQQRRLGLSEPVSVSYPVPQWFANKDINERVSMATGSPLPSAGSRQLGTTVSSLGSWTPHQQMKESSKFEFVGPSGEWTNKMNDLIHQTVSWQESPPGFSESWNVGEFSLSPMVNSMLHNHHEISWSDIVEPFDGSLFLFNNKETSNLSVHDELLLSTTSNRECKSSKEQTDPDPSGLSFVQKMQPFSTLPMISSHGLKNIRNLALISDSASLRLGDSIFRPQFYSSKTDILTDLPAVVIDSGVVDIKHRVGSGALNSALNSINYPVSLAYVTVVRLGFLKSDNFTYSSVSRVNPGSFCDVDNLASNFVPVLELETILIRDPRPMQNWVLVLASTCLGLVRIARLLKVAFLGSLALTIGTLVLTPSRQFVFEPTHYLERLGKWKPWDMDVFHIFSDFTFGCLSASTVYCTNVLFHLGMGGLLPLASGYAVIIGLAVSPLFAVDIHELFTSLDCSLIFCPLLLWSVGRAYLTQASAVVEYVLFWFAPNALDHVLANRFVLPFVAVHSSVAPSLISYEVPYAADVGMVTTEADDVIRCIECEIPNSGHLHEPQLPFEFSAAPETNVVSSIVKYGISAVVDSSSESESELDQDEEDDDEAYKYVIPVRPRDTPAAATTSKFVSTNGSSLQADEQPAEPTEPTLEVCVLLSQGFQQSRNFLSSIQAAYFQQVTPWTATHACVYFAFVHMISAFIVFYSAGFCSQWVLRLLGLGFPEESKVISFSTVDIVGTQALEWVLSLLSRTCSLSITPASRSWWSLFGPSGIQIPLRVATVFFFCLYVPQWMLGVGRVINPTCSMSIVIANIEYYCGFGSMMKTKYRRRYAAKFLPKVADVVASTVEPSSPPVVSPPHHTEEDVSEARLPTEDIVPFLNELVERIMNDEDTNLADISTPLLEGLPADSELNRVQSGADNAEEPESSGKLPGGFGLLIGNNSLEIFQLSNSDVEHLAVAHSTAASSSGTVSTTIPQSSAAKNVRQQFAKYEDENPVGERTETASRCMKRISDVSDSSCSKIRKLDSQEACHSGSRSGHALKIANRSEKRSSQAGSDVSNDSCSCDSSTDDIRSNIDPLERQLNEEEEGKDVEDEEEEDVEDEEEEDEEDEEEEDEEEEEEDEEEEEEGESIHGSSLHSDSNGSVKDKSDDEEDSFHMKKFLANVFGQALQDEAENPESLVGQVLESRSGAGGDSGSDCNQKSNGSCPSRKDGRIPHHKSFQQRYQQHTLYDVIVPLEGYRVIVKAIAVPCTLRRVDLHGPFVKRISLEMRPIEESETGISKQRFMVLEYDGSPEGKPTKQSIHSLEEENQYDAARSVKSVTMGNFILVKNRHSTSDVAEESCDNEYYMRICLDGPASLNPFEPVTVVGAHGTQSTQLADFHPIGGSAPPFRVRGIHLEPAGSSQDRPTDPNFESNNFYVLQYISVLDLNAVSIHDALWEAESDYSESDYDSDDEFDDEDIEDTTEEPEVTVDLDDESCLRTDGLDVTEGSSHEFLINRPTSILNTVRSKVTPFHSCRKCQFRQVTLLLALFAAAIFMVSLIITLPSITGSLLVPMLSRWISRYLNNENDVLTFSALDIFCVGFELFVTGYMFGEFIVEDAPSVCFALYDMIKSVATRKVKESWRSLAVFLSGLFGIFLCYIALPMAAGAWVSNVVIQAIFMHTPATVSGLVFAPLRWLLLGSAVSLLWITAMRQLNYTVWLSPLLVVGSAKVSRAQLQEGARLHSRHGFFSAEFLKYFYPEIVFPIFVDLGACIAVPFAAAHVILPAMFVAFNSPSGFGRIIHFLQSHTLFKSLIIRAIVVVVPELPELVQHLHSKIRDRSYLVRNVLVDYVSADDAKC